MALLVLLCAGCGAASGQGAGGSRRSAALPPGIRHESIQVPGPAGALKAELFLAETRWAKSDRRPAVVLLHGCGGLYTARGGLTARHRDWALRFADWGFVVLMPDSFGSRGVGPICELKDRPVHPWNERTQDAYAALDHLVRRPDVDPGKVLVMGWSNGGSTVTGVVRPEAPGRREAKAAFRAAVAYYPGCERPLRQKAYRSTVPLLIQHGAADDWTPAAPCVELAAKLRRAGMPIETIVYPEAHHGFDAPDTPVRLLPNVYNPGAPGQRGAHVGTHPAARLRAIEDTKRFVDRELALR